MSSTRTGEAVRTADDRTYVLESGRAGSLIVDPADGFRDITTVDLVGADG